jgi:YggT family protein
MIIHLADLLIRAIMMLIAISAILSWFQPDPRNPIVRLIQGIVGPVLHPIQALIPPLGGIDLSPLIAILLLGLLRSLILPVSIF